MICTFCLRRFTAASPLRIGLLGGSFNPAHAGHVHISQEACKRLGLDAIWWIVSPANPLKDPATLAPFDVRCRYALRQAASHAHIHVSDMEERCGIRYTVDTLKLIRRRFPRHHFVWLMGSDNLAGFHRWKRWEEIAALVPVAVMDRGSATHRASRMRFATRYAARRRPASTLAGAAPPAWNVVFIRRHPESATHLRKILGNHAFLEYNKQ